MKITMGKHLNLNAAILENELIRLCVLPELGAKIASLNYKPQRFKVFSQPAKNKYKLPINGDDYSKYDTSGADDIFPSIDSCVYPYENYFGRICPGHGELWATKWSVESSEDKNDPCLICEKEGSAFPYNFKREISLHGNTVRLDYEIWNGGDFPLYGLWAFHGLANCDEMTKIILPGVDEVVNAQESMTLGTKGKVHSWPVNADNFALNRVLSPLTRKTEKYYANKKLETGDAALTLNQGKLLYRLNFPTKQIPYIGVWINEGGYKGEYNCALEPSNGFFDSLEITKQLKTLKPIPAKKTLKWRLEISLEEIDD